MDECTIAVLLLKGIIAELPAEDQAKIDDYVVRLRAITDESDLARLAFGWVGAEQAALP